jgi:DNA polymerase-3 subunit delta'
MSQSSQKFLYPWLDEPFKKIISNELPQAMLIYGAKDIGKFQFGIQLTKYLLCESKAKKFNSCDECDACRWFSAGNHPDFLPVLPEDLESQLNFTGIDDNSLASNDRNDEKKLSKFIRIDQIRKTISNIETGTHRGNKKIVLIYPVEAMQTAAANSLLKSLEEPPKDVLMILITHQLDQILPTIRSRCRLLPINQPTFEAGLNWLKNELNQLKISSSDIELIYRENGGAILKSFEQLKNGQSSNEGLGIVNYLLKSTQLNQQDISEIIGKNSIEKLISTLQKWIQDLLFVKNNIDARYFPNQISKLGISIDQISFEKLLNFSNKLKAAKKHSTHPLNHRIQSEQLLIEYVHIFK